MSLLPLTVLDCLRRAFRDSPLDRFAPPDRHVQLAQRIIASASLADVIRWRGVSRAFRAASQKRLEGYTRVHVRVYQGLTQLKETAPQISMEWPCNSNVLVCEMAPGTVGICVDAKLHWKDAKTMIALIAVFRRSAEYVFMDSPVVDHLLKHLNSAKVKAIIQLLSSQRRPSSFPSSPFSFLFPVEDNHNVIVLPDRPASPPGTFFPRLKQFTVTCNKSQLSHLSRVIGYCVAVDNVFEKEAVDLVCLQVILGESWCRSKQRLFRHVSSFKQWIDASSLGVKYVQQFQGDSKRKSAL